MVVISRPSAWTASIVQHFTDSPSTQHRARAAARRVAADVGAGEPDVVAQVVHEQPARLDVVSCATEPLTVTEISIGNPRIRR